MFYTKSMLLLQQIIIKIKKQGGRLPIKWMAPEALRRYAMSTASDVYVFHGDFTNEQLRCLMIFRIFSLKNIQHFITIFSIFAGGRTVYFFSR